MKWSETTGTAAVHLAANKAAGSLYFAVLLYNFVCH